MIASITFRQIETLRAVFLTGSVTGAAERLGVTQPAVSHILRDVDDNLGFQLFDRRPGRISPTERGLLLWREIQRSYISFDSINEFCRRLREAEAPDIQISSIPIVSTALLPAAIRKFQDVAGERFFRIRPQDTENAIAAARFQTADLSFGANLDPVPGVESEDIGCFDLLCFLPPGHPAASREVVTINDVTNLPMIGLSDLEGIGPAISDALPGAAARLRPAVVCPSAITAAAMVEAGLGFTLLDPITAHICRNTAVVTRRFDPNVKFTIRAYWPMGRETHFDRAAFIGFVKARAAEIAASQTAARA